MSDVEDLDLDMDMDIEDPEDEDISEESEGEGEAKGDDDEEEDEESESQIDLNNKTKYIVIKPENCRTSNMISLFELVNVIGSRAQMIDSSISETIYVPIEGKRNAIEIAVEEIKMGKCPLNVERVVYQDSDTTKVEVFSVNELIIPDIF